MPKTRKRVAKLLAGAVALTFLAGCSAPNPEPTPSVDPRAVSEKVALGSDGYAKAGSGVAIPATVPTYFSTDAGVWKMDLTVESITPGVTEDLKPLSDVIETKGVVPYYVHIVAEVTAIPNGASLSGITVASDISYTTASGISAPSLVSASGVFPDCDGSATFRDSTKLVFCQVALSTPSDPVDQVNWHPADTAYDKDSGSPIFFRPLSEN